MRWLWYDHEMYVRWLKDDCDMTLCLLYTHKIFWKNQKTSITQKHCGLNFVELMHILVRGGLKKKKT